MALSSYNSKVPKGLDFKQFLHSSNFVEKSGKTGAFKYINEEEFSF